MCAQEVEIKCPMGDECPCPKVKCENFGKCCQCIKTHRANGSLTHCMAKLERT
jgi:hypothetical protein